MKNPIAITLQDIIDNPIDKGLDKTTDVKTAKGEVQITENKQGIIIDIYDESLELVETFTHWYDGEII